MEKWAELSAGERVPVTVTRRANARRISLRVNQTDGRVSVTAPNWVSGREIDRFLSEHRDWLGTALEGVAEQEVAGIGALLPIEGHAVRIVASPRARGVFRATSETLDVGGNPDTAPLRVRAYLKELARERLVAASAAHCGSLGRSFARISLRDPRSRWGSCSSAGNLMYSWRLIMAPPEVLDYVAAHEVAHLQEMNHSARFWALVADLKPDYQAPRRWLRDNGKQLHRWQFGER